MPDNTIEWGQGAVNNTNDWGKAKANATNNFGAVYDDSPSLDTNITGSTGAVLSISYSASAFCENASDPTPTVTDNVGAGTFSSTTGLVFVSTTTGQVDLSASTTGATYLITYTDTNAATATFNLTVNALDNASFAYSASSYSQADADPTPTPVLAGGTFSAGSGLVFVDSGSNTGSSTGQIDLSASTVASYTITYTTAGTCPNTSTQTVGITAALAQVNNVYSMDFDGINDYIDANVVNLPQGNSNFSVSCWFKRDSSNGNYGAIISFGTSAQRQQFYLNFAAGGSNLKFGFYIEDYSRGLFATNSTDWYNAIVIFDNSIGTYGTAKLYVNGNLEKTFALTGTLNITGSSLNLGRTYPTSVGTNYYYTGLIDEVAVFNTALTEAEILSIYNATETGKTADLNDLTTPPVKWYRMGD